MSTDDLAWWRSWRDKQVHGFRVATLRPETPPDDLTALCGHVAPLAVIEPTSSGMPCVLCVARIPMPHQHGIEAR
ncbi:hypothetical protein JOF53_003265 [Crossiella equi]|uniref:Uncharacterized protein n=1 Tax=Crossiella equi TaxID=130796 RepID=A0ABS5ACT4_9PSEU|nr:hypothetical protein [Crossiella equi]MBP2474393.1 hypothetical protein [Crossiella equi]